MAHGRIARRSRGEVRDRADRPRRPARGPAGRADGQLPRGPDHLQRGLAGRGGGDAADLPGERGRAAERAGRFRCGRRGDHGRVPAEGLRRPGRSAGGPVRGGPRRRRGLGRSSSGAGLRPGGGGRAGIDRGPVRHRPRRPAVHRRDHRPVQGRPAHPRQPVLVRVGGEPEHGAGQREQRGPAAPPGARLRAAGLLRWLSPGRGRQDHPHALVRPGGLGEAGRRAPGAGQRAGAVDDPDAARPAAGGGRPVRADGYLLRGVPAGRRRSGGSSRRGCRPRRSTRDTAAPSRPR